MVKHDLYMPRSAARGKMTDEFVNNMSGNSRSAQLPGKRDDCNAEGQSEQPGEAQYSVRAALYFSHHAFHRTWHGGVDKAFNRQSQSHTQKDVDQHDRALVIAVLGSEILEEFRIRWDDNRRTVLNSALVSEH